MSNKRILQFDTASQLETDDYLLIDHASEGTRKILASAIGGGSSAYSGSTEPASNFGSNGDIYFQIENLFNPTYSDAYVWSNVSVTKKANDKFTIVMSGTSISTSDDECVIYKIKNLEVGKDYTFKFDAQMSSETEFMSGGTYGLQFVEHSNDYNPALTGTAGEFDETNLYMPFYKDANNHSYECTITATASTMYMVFGLANIRDAIPSTLTIDDLECSIPYIINIYTKNDNLWVKYLSGSNGRGGGGAEIDILYNNPSGAPYQTNLALTHNFDDYDVIYMTLSNDTDISGFNIYCHTSFMPAMYESGQKVSVQGLYGTRVVDVSFSGATFNITRVDGDYQDTIYKIAGIKY